MATAGCSLGRPAAAALQSAASSTARSVDPTALASVTSAASRSFFFCVFSGGSFLRGGFGVIGRARPSGSRSRTTGFVGARPAAGAGAGLLSMLALLALERAPSYQAALLTSITAVCVKVVLHWGFKQCGLP